MKIGRQATLPPREEFIQAGQDSADERMPGLDWGFLLVAFMRVVSGLWIFRGLLHWVTILWPDATPFETLPTAVAGGVIFFAVADLIAGVGLWLASAWGGVLWLFSALANIVVTLAIPDFHSGGYVMLMIDLGLVVGYFILTWKAARERHR